MSARWDDVGYVISSAYRLAVIRELSDGAATPTELASAIETSTTHVSRALRQLRDRGLVALAVPGDRAKNRRCELTERGQSAWETIRANDLTG
ncbi:helix-turn-helix domain-containing protein [Halorubrum trueperi]|uniref:Helix-turn-helix domain-containing protein n=1 Tax=Halorubrum trueperi TaxID=2004704 RepID=A0ABD5UJE4_9EURY